MHIPLLHIPLTGSHRLGCPFFFLRSLKSLLQNHFPLQHSGMSRFTGEDTTGMSKEDRTGIRSLNAMVGVAHSKNLCDWPCGLVREAWEESKTLRQCLCRCRCQVGRHRGWIGSSGGADSGQEGYNSWSLFEGVRTDNLCRPRCVCVLPIASVCLLILFFNSLPTPHF
jgi:hypothetical protein